VFIFFPLSHRTRSKKKEQKEENKDDSGKSVMEKAKDEHQAMDVSWREETKQNMSRIAFCYFSSAYIGCCCFFTVHVLL
jgi:hypothetical protein